MYFDPILNMNKIKSKEEYALLWMELLKEGYDEFLYRGLEPKGTTDELKEKLVDIKNISTPEEWNSSLKVKEFRKAINLSEFKESEISLVSYVKPFDFEEIIGLYVLNFYDDLDEAVEKLSKILERIESRGECDFAYTPETLQVIKVLADYDREFSLEN